MIRRASLRAMGSAGDTLVEVAMALAILSATLLTAFHIASLSYAEGMQAREHTQAIQLAQDQAEKLRYWRDYMIQQYPSALDNPTIFTPTSLGFCYGSGNPCNITIDPTGVPTLHSGELPISPYEGMTYHVGITPNNPTPGGPALINPSRMQFKVDVQWDAPVSASTIGSQTNQNITEIPLILVDKRGIVPRDCSVVGTSRCN